MSCGRRRGLDPALPELWCRPAVTAPIGPLASEPPYATGAALEKKKKKKNLTAAALVATEIRVLSPGLSPRVKGPGIATAAAWIQSLSWELPYAMGVAIKNKKILDFLKGSSTQQFFFFL